MLCAMYSIECPEGSLKSAVPIPRAGVGNRKIGLARLINKYYNVGLGLNRRLGEYQGRCVKLNCVYGKDWACRWVTIGAKTLTLLAQRFPLPHTTLPAAVLSFSTGRD